MRPSWWAGFSLLGYLTLSASPASAYTIQSLITKGCHERITTTALLSARLMFPTTAKPITLEGDDKVASEDTPFTMNDERREANALHLLFSVRDPDLGGRTGLAINELAFIHGDPNSQEEHCLRAPTDDDPNGSAELVARCQKYLRTEFAQAISGLDASGAPDMTRRETMEVALGIRGQVDLRIPVFHRHMGRVLHGVQDSFTHLLRTSDSMQVVSALNWVDWINGDFDEARDGHEHLDTMDNCEDDHPLLTTRRQLAEQASTQVLAIAYDPALSVDEKTQQFDALLATYITFKADSNCTAANNWCDAPELDVPKPGCGCQVPGSGGGSERGGLMALLLAGAGVVARSRRRRQLAVAAGVALACAAPTTAHAEEEQKLTTEYKAPEVKPVRGFAFYGAVGATIDHPALAFTVAGRYRFNEAWLAGLDAEWNPFYNTYVKEFQRGVFNVYATGIRQYPLKFAEINLLTTVNLGTSILLQDLVGAPAGKPGLYFGIAPLGIEWRIKEGVNLVFDPLHVAFPVPQLSGVPYGYRQYRTTIGIELG